MFRPNLFVGSCLKIGLTRTNAKSGKRNRTGRAHSWEIELGDLSTAHSGDKYMSLKVCNLYVNESDLGKIYQCRK
jgi:hypothetical protein